MVRITESIFWILAPQLHLWNGRGKLGNSNWVSRLIQTTTKEYRVIHCEITYSGWLKPAWKSQPTIAAAQSTFSLRATLFSPGISTQPSQLPWDRQLHHITAQRPSTGGREGDLHLLCLLHLFKQTRAIYNTIYNTYFLQSDALRPETDSYTTPRLLTKFRERAFSFSSPASWNSLPAELRTISDTSVFKNKLKTYLLGLAFDIQSTIGSCFMHPNLFCVGFYWLLFLYIRFYVSFIDFYCSAPMFLR